jgi:outer membrane biosynthesis protein TonB
MTSKTKGLVGSITVHVTILVLLIIFGFSTPLPLPGEDGILINFGDDNEGMGLREPRPSPRQDEATPVEPVPDKREETPITQDFEDAPSIPVTKPQPKPQPKQEKPTETKPIEKPVEQPKQEEVKPREVDKKALFPGQKDGGSTTGEGETGKQGNQGDPAGSTDSQSREGGKTSGGDGISFSLGEELLLRFLCLPMISRKVEPLLLR